MVEPVRDVLLLVADQWRGDTLGILGAPGVQTPNLDALAAEGTTFTNHWCQASPCGPSRRSLLTSTEVRVHGQWTNDDPAIGDLVTLGQAARAAGLRPALIGYTDTPSSAWDPKHGWQATKGAPASAAEVGPALFDQAFDLIRPFFWQLGFPTYRNHLITSGLGPPTDELLGIYPPDGQPSSDHLAPSKVPAEHSDTAWLTDAALDLLDNSTEPTLLHVNWLRPHPPFVPPAPYHQLVDPDAVALPSRSLGLAEQIHSHPFFANAGHGRRQLNEYLQEPRRVQDVTEADDRRLRAAYYGLCAEVDHHLGRIVEKLKTTGRWDQTMVIFISDHGDALGDHWLYGRRGPFDGHFRVPCIIRDPRHTANNTRGKTVDRFTTNGDIMPTILEAIGGDTPSTAGGRALDDLMRGSSPADTETWRSHVRYEMDWSDHNLGRESPQHSGGDDPSKRSFPDRFCAVRTDRYRYVDFAGLPPMLFDLVEDPDESTNRAGDPALTKIQNELHQLTLAP